MQEISSPDLRPGAAPMPPAQHLVAGRYRTRARIGKGRLGEIYAATNESLGPTGVVQQVALQLIPENVVRNNQLFNKLNLGYTELGAAAHPNIVAYRSFGRHSVFGVLVMDLLEGASLRQTLDVVQTLPLDEVKPVIRSVGEALRMLHARDIVHGNLTPDNVFITDSLDVKMLDVIPLGSSDGTFRALATSDPLQRSTMEDDVFGLACLAYEMLAGKHPFGHCSPSEIRKAGLEAARVPSLPDGEWAALNAALSFDEDQPSKSITKFMTAFGVAGTERLRPSPEPVSKQPVATINESAEPVITATPFDDPYAPHNNRMPPEKKNRSKRNPLNAIALGLFVASIAALLTLSEPKAVISNLIAEVDHSMNGASAPAPVVTEIPPAPAVEEAIAKPEADQPDIAQAVAIERPEAMEVLATPDQPASIDLEEALPAADEYAVTIVISPEEPVSSPAVMESVVSVSERDGAARIDPEFIDGQSAPLVWWTSEYTATADDDFIPANRQSVSGDNSVLHIPLVNDNVAESRESFFVNFGTENMRQGQIERIATVRVDIIDDDAR